MTCRWKTSLLLPSALALLFSTACATTTLRDVWATPERPHQPPDRGLAGMGTAQPAIRRAFETRMASELREAGLQAVASHTLDPRERVPDLDGLAVRS